MKKTIIGAGMILALVLAGCAPQEPRATVTVTATADSGSSGGSTIDVNSLRGDDKFDYYLDFLGANDLYAYSPALDSTLQDLGRNTCDMFDAGFTRDEVTMLAVESLGVDDGSGLYELVAMTMVAGTYAYCPEWTWVWG